MKGKKAIRKAAVSLTLVNLFAGGPLVLAAEAGKAVKETTATTAETTADSNETSETTASGMTDMTESSAESTDSSSADSSETAESSTVETTDSDTESGSTETETSVSSSDSAVSTPESSTVPERPAESTADSDKKPETSTTSTTASSIDKNPPSPESTTKPIVTTDSSAESTATAPAAASGYKAGSQLNSAALDLTAVETIAASDLSGFELPLLSTFADKRQAALLMAALQQLGLPYEEQEAARTIGANFDKHALLPYLYQQVFGVDIGQDWTSLRQNKEVIPLAEIQIGDLLVWEEDQQLGLYLGQGNYLYLDYAAEVTASDKEKAADNVQADIKAAAQTDTESTSHTTAAESDLTNPRSVKIGQLLTAEETTEERPADVPFTDIVPDQILRVDQAKLTLTETGEAWLKSYAASLEFTVNERTQNFITTIAEDARALGLEYDVFASVMIAQAILESGSGTSGLSSSPYHNLFGIKGDFNGGSVTFATKEDDGTGSLYQISAAFRAYPAYGDSLGDYVSLLKKGISGNTDFYKGAWRSEAGNYLQATAFLTGRYATDTSYANKLNSLIATYNLTRYDRPKAEAGVILQSRSEIPESYRSKLIYPDYDGVNYNTSGSYPVGQCTWYVYNRMAQLGKVVDNFMGNGGEWGTKGAALGYTVTDIPTVGYAVSFSPGTAGSSTTYGHVAFVEAVGSEGILISEGNVLGGTTISYRVIPNEIARSNQATYIKPK